MHENRPARLRLSASLNLPNLLTSMRLVLAIILFCMMAQEQPWAYRWAFVLFIVAAGTDWVDGYFARKWHQVTTLGRILDPFADKVIMCGTFILLAAVPALSKPWWGFKPWMVVVIVGRELLVTALRSFIENQGSDFSANLSGKLKMVLQCVTAGACLFYLSYPLANDGVRQVGQWLIWVVGLSIASTLLLTVYSGVVYVLVAVRLLREDG